MKYKYNIISKYNNQELKFKCPNTVMIFSNGAPKTEELATDHWKIFSIKNDALVEWGLSDPTPSVPLSANKNQSERLNKKKKNACDSDNDIEDDTDEDD